MTRILKQHPRPFHGLASHRTQPVPILCVASRADQREIQPPQGNPEGTQAIAVHDDLTINVDPAYRLLRKINYPGKPKAGIHHPFEHDITIHPHPEFVSGRMQRPQLLVQPVEGSFDLFRNPQLGAAFRPSQPPSFNPLWRVKPRLLYKIKRFQAKRQRIHALCNFGQTLLAPVKDQIGIPPLVVAAGRVAGPGQVELRKSALVKVRELLTRSKAKLQAPYRWPLGPELGNHYPLVVDR